MLDCREVVARLGRFLDDELSTGRCTIHRGARPGVSWPPRELQALQPLSASSKVDRAASPGRHSGEFMGLVKRRPAGQPDGAFSSFGNRGLLPCACPPLAWRQPHA